MVVLSIFYLLFLNLFMLPKIHCNYGRYFDVEKLSSCEFFAVIFSTFFQIVLLFLLGHGADSLYVAQIMFAVTGIFLLDLKFQIIPDVFNLAGVLAVAGLLFDSTKPWFGLHDFLYCLVPLILLFLSVLYKKLTGKSGLGQGDIKLLLWLVPLVGSLGLKSIFVSMLLALPKAFLTSRIESASAPFAFGPYLVAGFFLTNSYFHIWQFW